MITGIVTINYAKLNFFKIHFRLNSLSSKSGSGYLHNGITVEHMCDKMVLLVVVY